MPLLRKVFMKNPRRVLLPLTLLVFVAGVSTSVQAAPSIPAETTQTTVPGTTQNTGGADYATAAYAKEKGVSEEVARKRLNQLSELTAYADTQRRKPDYAGFRIVEAPNGPEGQLATTSVKSPSFDEAHKMRLVLRNPRERRPQRVGETDREGAGVRNRRRARDSGRRLHW